MPDFVLKAFLTQFPSREVADLKTHFKAILKINTQNWKLSLRVKYQFYLNLFLGLNDFSESLRQSAGQVLQTKRTLSVTAVISSLLHLDCMWTLTSTRLGVKISTSYKQLNHPTHQKLANYLWRDCLSVVACWRDFKTIWNLIYHLDALFTEELCIPGNRQTGA